MYAAPDDKQDVVVAILQDKENMGNDVRVMSSTLLKNLSVSVTEGSKVQ